MKKILTVICCFAILATTAFAAVGCDLFGGSNVITAGDENSVYAVSMLSGAGMLGVMDENEKSDERRNEAQPPKTDKLGEGATVRPAAMLQALNHDFYDPTQTISFPKPYSSHG